MYFFRYRIETADFAFSHKQLLIRGFIVKLPFILILLIWKEQIKYIQNIVFDFYLFLIFPLNGICHGSRDGTNLTRSVSTSLGVMLSTNFFIFMFGASPVSVFPCSFTDSFDWPVCGM